MQQQVVGHKKSSRVVTFNEEKYTTKTRPNYGLLAYTLCRTTIQHTYLPFVVPEKLSEVLVRLETRKKNSPDKDSREFLVPRKTSNGLYAGNDVTYVFRYSVSNPCIILSMGRPASFQMELIIQPNHWMVVMPSVLFSPPLTHPMHQRSSFIKGVCTLRCPSPCRPSAQRIQVHSGLVDLYHLTSLLNSYLTLCT